MPDDYQKVKDSWDNYNSSTTDTPKPNGLLAVVKATRDKNFIPAKLDQPELGTATDVINATTKNIPAIWKNLTPKEKQIIAENQNLYRKPEARQIDPVTGKVLSYLIAPMQSFVSGIESGATAVGKGLTDIKAGMVAGTNTSLGQEKLISGALEVPMGFVSGLLGASAPFNPTLAGFAIANKMGVDIAGESAVNLFMSPVSTLTNPESDLGKTSAELADLIYNLAIFRKLEGTRAKLMSDGKPKELITENNPNPIGVAMDKVSEDFKKTTEILKQQTEKQNAPKEGIVPKNNQPEYQSGNKSGETTQTSDSNSPVKSGEVQKEIIPKVEADYGLKKDELSGKAVQIGDQTFTAPQSKNHNVAMQKAIDALGEDKVKQAILNDNYKVGDIVGGKFQEVAKAQVQQTAEPKTTSIKNAVVNQERLDKGLEELKTEGTRKWGSVFGEAEQKIKSGEVDPRKLASDLKDNPRPTTDTENAILAYDRVTLDNQQNALSEKVAQNPNDLGAKAELLKIEDQFNNNDIASRQIGTQTGQALNIRKALIGDDYSLSNIKQAARTANKGEPLPDEVRQRLTTVTKQLQETQQKLASVQEANVKLQSEQQFKNIKFRENLKKRTEKRAQTKVELDSEYNDLVGQFAKTQSLNIAFTSEQVSLFGKMAKNRIRAGVNTLEGIVDEIYSAVREKVGNELTKRDIRDAISGYGKYTPLTKDEINLKLKDIKTQGRLVSQIEDVQNKQMPLKTGFERQKLSDKAKALQKRLNNAKKASGMYEDVPLQAYKTRLANEKIDLERRLKEGDYSTKPRNVIKLDPETEKLRGDVRKLKANIRHEISQIELQNRTKMQKAQDVAAEIANLPRTLMSSTDLSAPYRQGIVASIAHPGIIHGKGGAFREMFKYFKSDEKFGNLETAIVNDADFGLAMDSKLHLSSISPDIIGKREEFFKSQYAEKIPGIGSVVKASERAYVGFLDKARYDLFTHFADEFRKGGYTFKDNPEVFKSLAELVNVETGRGSLGKFEAHASLLNGVFFAPKYLAARLNMLNPFWYAKLAKPVRIMAMKDMLKFVGSGITILGMAKLAGAGVEVNPLSSDFGKIRIGNTRIDLWGGFQPIIRNVSQIMLGRQKVNGHIKKLDSWNQLERFVESKFAPMAGFIKDYASNRNYIGEKFNMGNEMVNYLTPLYLQDLISAIKDSGVTGGLMTTPGIFGVGVQTYHRTGHAGFNTNINLNLGL